LAILLGKEHRPVDLWTTRLAELPTSPTGLHYDGFSLSSSTRNDEEPLGFKSLVARTAPPPKIHDLKKLFELVPQATQDRIVTACSPTRAAFNTSIAAIANVFEEWRYVYEQEAVQLDMAFLQRLADTVYTIINEPAP
ncbi:MAG: hypothetical protein L6Q63_16735, partial [Giesbergeria sp.]|nr:hypothetical protein [Giesbergeria sp.]